MAQLAAALDLQSRNGVDAKWEALAKLEALAEEVGANLARNKANKALRRAVHAWKRGDFPRAAQLALEAVNADESYGPAYHLLAMALERMGFRHKALVTYERALALSPDNPNILLDLGLAAWRLDMPDVAEKLFRRFIDERPNSPLGYNNLGSILAQTDKSSIAIEILRDAIYRMPSEAMLWNTIATLLAEDGRIQESLVFYHEAIRLEPTHRRSIHNLGYAYLHMGLMSEALECFDEALVDMADPTDRLEARYTRSICLIGMGRLEEGFEEYEVRADELFRAHAPHMLKAPVWNGEPLEGKRLLVCAEQGLGDELMLANTLPDLARAVGPTGKLQIAVNQRLVPLFQRAFPEADVGVFEDRVAVNADGRQTVRYVPFAVEDGEPDYYVRMGSTMRLLRKRIEDFPKQAVLKPDPARVEHYRGLLRARGNKPTVGFAWRSMMMAGKRAKYYSTLDQWEPLLKTPGVRFVNVQYGDCTQELTDVASKSGIEIEVIDGLDLTHDIEGAAALSAALDLVISPSTASAAIAGSIGTEVWFVNPCRAWTQLGTDHVPFFPKTRAFFPAEYRDWPTVISVACRELRTRLGQD